MSAWERLPRARLRYWLHRARWRLLAPTAPRPRVFANSFPKSGTHLLWRCLAQLPGLVQNELGLFGGALEDELGAAEPGAAREPVPVGMWRPRAVERADLENLLRGLRPGDFTAGHMPYSAPFAELLDSLGLRALLILRDPRDMVVSRVFHQFPPLRGAANRYLNQTLQTKDERLLACIQGFQVPKDTSGYHYPDIGSRLRLFLPWLQVPFNYTTRFERLVGAQGGGSAETQRAEISSIARHLGLSVTPARIEAIAGNLFGRGSVTFRRGQVGSWREHFREEHKAAFKRVAGAELIQLGYERDLNW